MSQGRESNRKDGFGWWKARRGRLLQLWGVGIVASLIVTGASAMGYLESLQSRALDLILWFRGQQFPSSVVIVAIDDAAFGSFGRRQPIPRVYLANLVRGIQRSGAAVVGLDIALITPTTPEGDTALAQAILDFGQDGVSRVVLNETMAGGGGALGDPRLSRAVVRGTDRVLVDKDGVIRRTPFLVPRAEGPSEPAFSLAITARLADMDQPALETALRATGGLPHLPAWRPGEGWVAGPEPPLAFRSGEFHRINFVGPAGSFLTIPSEAIVHLGGSAAGIASDNPLRGRIVLVGGTFRESRDFFQTPHGLMPGVEVHANLVHMLVTRSFIVPSGWAASLLFQAAAVFLAGLILVKLRPLAGTLVCIGGAALVGLPASYVAFYRGGYWVDFLLPVLATCLLGVGTHALERRRLQDSFGRYVSREVMAQVLDDAPSLRGERREVSVLFSDLRGFTSLSERLPPETIAAHLNEYFDAMTKAIFAHKGMINDFIGDAVMAIFGAPLAEPNHVLHAVQSALAMDQALQALNRQWERHGLPSLRMGIGIHTGEVFAGNVGGTERFKYTVIGDAVNVAARLESLNKELGTTILITEETRTVLGDRAEVKDWGERSVKGRDKPLHVFEILSLKG